MLSSCQDVLFAGMTSKLGGDIQIQLALAMQANRKEEECISMFRHLEETHPVRAIQRQAANLRFIMEAPKLEIGDDEKVQVPVLDLDSNKCEPILLCHGIEQMKHARHVGLGAAVSLNGFCICAGPGQASARLARQGLAWEARW